MLQADSLIGKFLIAMPRLEDPNFNKAVLLMCAHSHDGALGLVVNQPHPVSMEEIALELGLQWHGSQGVQICQGGPLSPERGFIVFERTMDLEGSMEISEGLFMTTNSEILNQLAGGEDIGRVLFALGYAGWAPNQLEDELRDHAWLICDMDRRLLFETPFEERWDAAIGYLGIDPGLLMHRGGIA
ncbi:YqgE/AlgH family protein [Magnetococcales bacterium HHB-1]